MDQAGFVVLSGYAAGASGILLGIASILGGLEKQHGAAMPSWYPAQRSLLGHLDSNGSAEILLVAQSCLDRIRKFVGTPVWTSTPRSDARSRLPECWRTGQ